MGLRVGKRGLFTRATLIVLLSSVEVISAAGQVSDPVKPEREISSAPDAQGSTARFRVQSDLVLVPVTVTTGKGRVVPGLEKEHFTVLEDRTPQVITHFTSEDAPASIGLVFDASDSMGPKMVAAP